MQDVLTRLAARIFQADEKVVSETEFFFDLERWDSLTQLEFIGSVESEFGVKFDRELVFQMISRSDVIEAIEAIRTAQLSTSSNDTRD